MKESAKRETEFKCRVCGGCKLVEEIVWDDSSPGLIGPGNVPHRSISGYHCATCTVKFEDPKKFSKNN